MYFFEILEGFPNLIDKAGALQDLKCSKIFDCLRNFESVIISSKN